MKASLALALLVLAGCGKDAQQVQNQAASPVVPVRIQPAENNQVQLTEEVAGTVRAKLHATLEAKVSGRIEKMPVMLGQQVKAGEMVARLDAAEIKARLDQAEATFSQADRDWARIDSLFKSQAVTRSEFDAADARKRMAKAAVEEAEAMLRYIELRAPFDGVVSRKWADVGDLASPGKPLIELEDPSALQLEADIPEALASSLRAGAALTLRVDALHTDVRGVLTEIAPSADPSSRTVKVKADLEKHPGLMPGQFARLLVPAGEAPFLSVPAGAVVRRGQLEIIFVIEGNAARLRLVKTGKLSGERTEILSGLAAGERVAVEGAESLVDGQTVEAR